MYSHNACVTLSTAISIILGSCGPQAERLIDLRDEEMVLREDDALGELPEELQYESLADLHDQIVEHMQGLLIQYRENNRPIDLSLVLKRTN